MARNSKIGKLQNFAKWKNAGAKFAQIGKRGPRSWVEIVIARLSEIKKSPTDRRNAKKMRPQEPPYISKLKTKIYIGKTSKMTQNSVKIGKLQNFAKWKTQGEIRQT